ncbi:hypothetical protein N0V94_006603 [Neodidymelliopsis sp. IMI 364377]|nr:hypothetical protein N0V94_006603 [Neodidymelliopsis sp. IMI 364377]
MSLSDQASMGEKTVDQTKQPPKLKPPFAPRPLPNTLATATLTPSPSSSQNGTVDGNQQQIVVDARSLPPLDSLPTIAGRGVGSFLANDDIKAFLEEDLALERLNKIHSHLWMAGRPMRARPLHRYKMYGYDMLGTQQMDLHLLRYSNKLLVKPLPEYMLSASFWEDHLCGDKDEELWKRATGWLLSYVWLITTPIDLKLAHDNSLLPPAITWAWWKSFVTDFLTHVDMNTLHHVNKRYQFGDLRLSRINSIYRTRFFFTHFVRGYLYGYNRYVVFFERNFSWILILFVFLSLVLSAMQVGTALDELHGSKAFLKGSYGVVVLSMVSVAAVLGIVGVCFVGIFFFNMVKAIAHAGSEQRKREELRKTKEHGE